MASSRYAGGALNSVSGLVAVVTGGGTGLGLVIAQTLAENGAAKVYITGRRLEKLEEAAQTAKNIVPIQGSTTSREDLQRAVDHISKETGYIDLLVNNAGISTFESGENPRPMPNAESSISEVRDYFFNYRDPQIWTDVLQTNVAAVFLASMAFLELLDAGNKRRAKEAPTSQIITVGSVGGLTRATPAFIYNASKAAVHHLMKNLGNAFVPFAIRTNVIAPGWFPTDMTTTVAKQFEDTGGVMPKELVPRQRMGNDEELAGTVLYLASKAGGYCNGAVLAIDGGFLANHAGVY